MKKVSKVEMQNRRVTIKVFDNHCGYLSREKNSKLFTYYLNFIINYGSNMRREKLAYWCLF